MWVRATALATYRVPGVPTDLRALRRHAEREHWTRRYTVAAHGAGWEYHVDSLPQAVRDAIGTGIVDRAATDPEPVAEWQRKAMEARAHLLLEVKRRAEEVGLTRARESLVRDAALGTLPPAIREAVATACRRGGALSTRTLKRWNAAARDGEARLAPKPPKKESAEHPSWLPFFLRLYAQPSKPSILQCCEELAGAGLPDDLQPPPLRTVHRTIAGLGAIARHRGRMVDGPKINSKKRPSLCSSG